MAAERGVFQANQETVPEMMDFVDSRIKDFPEKAAYDIRLTCEEILVNIASYAYPGGDGRLAVVWDDERSNKRLKVDFIDWGTPFNPLEKDSPDLNVPMMERKIGGLGIMMVRKLMDSVCYSRADGSNVLTVVKNY